MLFRSALTSGYHLAFWIGAGLVTVAIATAVFVLEGGSVPAPGGVAAEEPRRVEQMPAGACPEVG